MIIGIIGNTAKPRAMSAISSFVELLRRRRVDYILAENLKRYIPLRADERTASLQKLGSECSILVTFGGDGTILSAAREIGFIGKPILGINIGTLGFLAEVLVEEIEGVLDELLSGSYQIIDRMVLRVSIERGTYCRTFYALNDVVVDRGPASRLIYIDAKVNDRFLNSYRADGLIVATPTGSTAYSLSAGGPLMMPTMNAIIVTPICPHSLSVRSIVLGDDSRIDLSIRKEAEPVQVNIDGCNCAQLFVNEILRIQKAEYAVRWISIGRRDFFSILRTKLNWGGDNHLASPESIIERRSR